MNAVPDCVWSTVLSLISLRNCTCGAISEPNAAVAIRHPPPDSLGSGSVQQIHLEPSLQSLQLLEEIREEFSLSKPYEDLVYLLQNLSGLSSMCG